MQRLCLALSFCFLLHGRSLAEEAVPASADAAAPESRVDAAAEIGTPERILVEPQKVQLSGPRQYQQLLVTGIYADGTLRDLTRVVTYSTADDKIAPVSDKGIVTTAGDGSTTITVQANSLQAQVAVAVQNYSQPDPVNFANEVVPALTRAGCNSGACHGTPSGKNGFRLSLQGYLPDQDYDVLTREAFGRRTNPLDAEGSLLLAKGTAVITHEGGKKLWNYEETYTAMRDWIKEGCAPIPEKTPQVLRLELLPRKRTLQNESKQQQVVAIAHYSDGSQRDVTPLIKFTCSDEQVATVGKNGLVTFQKRGSVAIICRYQHLVDNARLSYLREVPGFVWNEPGENNYVDKHVFSKLKELQILPSEPCSDEEFVRRVHLDVAGVLPDSQTVAKFLADASPDKRDRLIGEVLQRREYADFWALKWADVLRSTRKQVAYRGAHNYRRFLVETFLHNRPFDEFVTELLTASGDTMMNPAANYYRVAREPLDCAETTAQLFMGVRMQCAKCHNHPFERWTQDDYYGFAAFFARIAHKKPDAKSETEVVYLARAGEVNHLRTGAVMAPSAPGGLAFEVKPTEDRRQYLADWLTGPENPFFAKSIVNRIWYHLMGKGIVDPVDDFRDSNPACNEELLNALASDFVKSGYNFKQIVETILKSKTYQLSAKTNSFNLDDEKYFSRAYTKLLSAEQLLDAICDVTGIAENFSGLPVGTRTIQLPDGEFNHQFLQAFGQPSRELACECARESESTLNQALNLINGDVIHAKLRDPNNRIGQLMKAEKSDEEIIGELYLVALSRPGSSPEIAGALAHVQGNSDRRRALEDVLWALINCKEFLFRH